MNEKATTSLVIFDSQNLVPTLGHSEPSNTTVRVCSHFLRKALRKLHRLAPNLSQIFLWGQEWNQKLTSPATNRASIKECLCDLRYSWCC